MDDDLDRKALRVGTLTANEFFLVDKSGNERVALLCSEGDSDEDPGHALIQLLDPNRIPRIELQVDIEGCCVRLNTPDDANGVTIGFAEDRGTGISISDREGKRAITIGISHPASGDPRGNHPEITLTDGDNHRSLTID